MTEEQRLAVERLPEKEARRLSVVPLRYDAEIGKIVFGVVENTTQTSGNCQAAAKITKAKKIGLSILGDKFESAFRSAYPETDDEFDSGDDLATVATTSPVRDDEASRREREELANNHRLAVAELDALARRPHEKQAVDMRAAAQYITTDFAYENDVCPLRFDETEQILYVSARRDTVELTNSVHHEAHCHVVLVPRSQKDIRADQKTTYQVPNDQSQTEASVMLEEILNEAIRERAADVLIEPIGETDHAQVRIAVDGRYKLSKNYGRFDWHSAQRIITIIREQGEVNPTDTRVPGDGRISKKLQGRMNNLRVNILPCFSGRQRVVLRFLNNTTNLRSIADLGMRPDMQVIFARAARRPGGFMTIAGPTGAGKTTTAYALIKEFSDLIRQNVCSIENPIECPIPGFGQIQVDADQSTAAETGQKTFADVLRALLRQNPQKIFLGEIRDEETLQEAMRAATTGIALLATVHADNAVKTVARLENLKADRLVIGQSLTAAASQRLIEMLCPDCKTPNDKQPSKEVIEIATAYGISQKNRQIYGPSPVGCDTCQRTSYRGRIGAFEILEIDSKVQEAIEKKEGLSTITSVAVTNGYRPMVVSAIESLLDGLTSEEKILSQLTYEDALRYESEAKDYTSKRVRPIETQISTEPDDLTNSGDDDDVLKF